MPTLDRLAARGLRYTNYHATPLCSPTRACLLSGRNHHAVGVGALVELSMGFPGYHGMAGPDQAFLPAVLRDAGYNTFAVGKWHLSPPTETSSAGPVPHVAARPGLRALLRVHGGRHQPVVPRPGAGQHAHPAAGGPRGRLPPQRRPRRPRHPDDQGRARRRPRQAVLPLLRHSAQAMPPTTSSPSGSSPTGGASTRGGTPTAPRCSTGRWPPASSRATPGCPSATPTCPPGTTSTPDARRMFARQMEVYAGFLTQTDHHVGRVLDFVDGLGELDDTIVVVVSDNGASAEGGPDGTFNESLFFNFVPERLEDNLPPLRRVGRRRHVPALLVGLDVGGHHAVPPLEARDLPGRGERALHRVVAGRHRRPRGGPPAVRPRHRHPAHAARRGRHRRARRRDRRAAAARPRGEPRRVVRRPRRPVAADDPVLRDARLPRHRPRRLAGGVPVRRAQPGRGGGPGRDFRFTELTPELLDEMDRNEWELFDLAVRPDRDDRSGRGRARTAAGDDRPLVRRGRALRRAPAELAPRPGPTPARRAAVTEDRRAAPGRGAAHLHDGPAPRRVARTRSRPT